MARAEVGLRGGALRHAAVLAATALVALSGCASIAPGGTLTDPTISTEQATQAAEDVALALNEVASRFLVSDPQGETLQVVSLEDDTRPAVRRLRDTLGVTGESTAFLVALAHHYRAHQPESLQRVETHVTGVEALGDDETGTSWLRVDVRRDEHFAADDDVEVASVATSYAVGWAAGQVHSIRAIHTFLDRGTSFVAPAATERLVEAVQRGDGAAVLEYTEGTGITTLDVSTLRDWIDAAGDYTVVELPDAQLGSLHVTYVVPRSGEPKEFLVNQGAGQRGLPLITWEGLGQVT